jgi:selenocysteine lyase/cysteine desulfurase
MVGRIEENRNPRTIRISDGIATNFADIYRFMTFLQS